jgi:hypothetical protein
MTYSPLASAAARVSAPNTRDGDLEFGRIVASEIEAPIILVNLV